MTSFREKMKKALTKTLEPSLLLHPNIPKPLHGTAPRTVLGEAWWLKESNNAKMKGYCQACGDTPKVLDAHEDYEINYSKGTMTYRRAVALCKDCHNFIHSGRLLSLKEKGIIPESEYTRIMQRGNLLIQKLEKPEYRGMADWSDWRLIVNGKSYEGKFKSFEDWKTFYGT